jgi:hypothetical protein
METYSIRWSHITSETEEKFNLWWHDEELGFHGTLEEAIIKLHYHLIKVMPHYKEKLYSFEITSKGKVEFKMEFNRGNF